MPFFYVCACKSVPVSKHMADFLESNDGAVQCLIAAVRISCRNADEAERIVAKVQGQPHAAMPKEWKDRLSEMSNEEKWAAYASAVEASMDVDLDEQYEKAIRKALDRDEPLLWKRIKEKLQESERHSIKPETDIKYIKKRIEQFHAPAYEYHIFSEPEALKKWDAIDLASAQHHFEQWLHSKDGSKNVDEKAFSVLRQCASIAKFLEDGNHTPEASPPLPKTDEGDFQSILHKYPFPRTPEERALWIRAGEVADIEKTVDTATLRKYRSGPAAEKTLDGLAGRDKDGRLWRKPGPNGQVLYLISSLRNKPK